MKQCHFLSDLWRCSRTRWPGPGVRPPSHQWPFSQNEESVISPGQISWPSSHNASAQSWPPANGWHPFIPSLISRPPPRLSLLSPYRPPVTPYPPLINLAYPPYGFWSYPFISPLPYLLLALPHSSNFPAFSSSSFSIHTVSSSVHRLSRMVRRPPELDFPK